MNKNLRTNNVPLGHISRVWRENHGGIAIMLALLTPVFIGLLMLSIDVGNTLRNQKLVQYQVDGLCAQMGRDELISHRIRTYYGASPRVGIACGATGSEDECLGAIGAACSARLAKADGFAELSGSSKPTVKVTLVQNSSNQELLNFELTFQQTSLFAGVFGLSAEEAVVESEVPMGIVDTAGLNPADIFSIMLAVDKSASAAGRYPALVNSIEDVVRGLEEGFGTPENGISRNKLAMGYIGGTGAVPFKADGNCDTGCSIPESVNSLLAQGLSNNGAAYEPKEYSTDLVNAQCRVDSHRTWPLYVSVYAQDFRRCAGTPVWTKEVVDVGSCIKPGGAILEDLPWQCDSKYDSVRTAEEQAKCDLVNQTNQDRIADCALPSPLNPQFCQQNKHTITDIVYRHSCPAASGQTAGLYQPAGPNIKVIAKLTGVYDMNTPVGNSYKVVPVTDGEEIPLIYEGETSSAVADEEDFRQMKISVSREWSYWACDGEFGSVFGKDKASATCVTAEPRTPSQRSYRYKLCNGTGDDCNLKSGIYQLSLKQEGLQPAKFADRARVAAGNQPTQADTCPNGKCADGAGICIDDTNLRYGYVRNVVFDDPNPIPEEKLFIASASTEGARGLNETSRPGYDGRVLMEVFEGFNYASNPFQEGKIIYNAGGSFGSGDGTSFGGGDDFLEQPIDAQPISGEEGYPGVMLLKSSNSSSLPMGVSRNLYIESGVQKAGYSLRPVNVSSLAVPREENGTPFQISCPAEGSAKAAMDNARTVPKKFVINAQEGGASAITRRAMTAALSSPAENKMIIPIVCGRMERVTYVDGITSPAAPKWQASDNDQGELSGELLSSIEFASGDSRAKNLNSIVAQATNFEGQGGIFWPVTCGSNDFHSLLGRTFDPLNGYFAKGFSDTATDPDNKYNLAAFIYINFFKSRQVGHNSE